jgi:hypothetical protein
MMRGPWKGRPVGVPSQTPTHSLAPKTRDFPRKTNVPDTPGWGGEGTRTANLPEALLSNLEYCDWRPRGPPGVYLSSGAGFRRFVGVRTAASLPKTQGKGWAHPFPVCFWEGNGRLDPQQIDEIRPRSLNKGPLCFSAKEMIKSRPTAAAESPLAKERVLVVYPASSPRNGPRHAHQGCQYMVFGPTGNPRFGGSGRPWRPGESFPKLGREAPHLLEGFSRPPGLRGTPKIGDFRSAQKPRIKNIM